MTTENNKGGRIEKILIAVALVLSAFFLFTLFYSVNFLSRNLLNALAPGSSAPSVVHFDIQGAKMLFP